MKFRFFCIQIRAVVSGNVGAVAKSIENALGKSIPLLIGFLASFLGISGLADRVIGVIHKIRQRIEKAITKFWTFVKSKAKGLLGEVGVGKKDKKDKKADDQRTTAEKQRDLDAGVKEGTRLLKDESLDKKEVQKRLEVLEHRYDLQELKIVTDKVEKDEEVLYIYGKVNPEKKGEKVKKKKKKHSEYTPINIEIKVVDDHKVTVTYEYDKEAHDNGKQNFTVTIDLNSVEDRKVTQTVDGNNLALKPEEKTEGIM